MTGDGNSWLTQRARFLVLTLNVAVLLAASYHFTGEAIPAETGRQIWLLAGIALWLGQLVTAPWFLPPRDSLANAVAAFLLTATIDISAISTLQSELTALKFFGMTAAGLAIALAVIAIILGKPQTGQGSGGQAAYKISAVLGRPQFLYAFPATISILGFYQGSLGVQVGLLGTLFLLIVAKPVEAATRIKPLLFSSKVDVNLEDIGEVIRIDSPNIIRVELDDVDSWMTEEIKLACLPDGKFVGVLPFFYHLQDDRYVGTGYIGDEIDLEDITLTASTVYSPEEDRADLLNDSVNAPDGTEPIGLVIEGTSVGRGRFEVIRTIHDENERELAEGEVVFCYNKGDLIYYQITGGETEEEVFDRNPHGRQVIIARELGTLNDQGAFNRTGWIPDMNTPVFRMTEDALTTETEIGEGEIQLGLVPGTDIPAVIDLDDLIEFHAAILGVTGTGKTETSFEIIREAVDDGVKVICVDFTGEYSTRLEDLDPQSLALDREKLKALEDKLFAVETGEYGAPKEKEALKEFLDEIRDPVKDGVNEFLSQDGGHVGIFELPEITSTSATILATELYLSTTMDWARRNRRKERILVVLEEAHTIIPEINWAFDKHTQWVVSRIAQIALQGRKYGVGLLVISQRTALVSKTVLSQCNTYISFSLYDKTSLGYLGNVLSAEHVEMLPNLEFLECIAGGKAVKGGRPLFVEIPFDQAKKDASNELDRPKHSNGETPVTPNDNEEAPSAGID